jgi:hypothetical protein
MSASTIIPESALVSEDWQLAEDGHKPASLVVQLRRGMQILPWFRFVYAEGDNTQVKIAFQSHMVNINGNGLAALLAAIASQRVVRIIQPSENEAKFGVRGPAASKYSGPAIDVISVDQFK